jgi:hypothetical protein
MTDQQLDLLDRLLLPGTAWRTYELRCQPFVLTDVFGDPAG